jgi:hypothetical protein
MASAGLLALLDDVAALTKVAAHKTAGIAGDDLALNAKALHGIDPARELPIVWSVARGSLINKAILIPVALGLTFFAPWAIIPLMFVGGAYLCFEGVEKLLHAWWHSDSHENLAQVPSQDAEADKIASAIRTDFILSAEIIIVSLGAIAHASFVQQTLVLIAIGIVMTVVIYGAVGGLVKLDDVGLHWMQTQGVKLSERMRRRMGRYIVWGAPVLLGVISILGTLAMFTVGGGIVLHSLPWLEHLFTDMLHVVFPDPSWAQTIAHMLMTGFFGVAVGAIAVPVFKVFMILYSYCKTIKDTFYK